MILIAVPVLTLVSVLLWVMSILAVPVLAAMLSLAYHFKEH